MLTTTYATLKRHIKCMVLPGQTLLLAHTNSILVTKVASRVSVMKVAWLRSTQMLTSLVNQTPIPQRWVYFITSTRKEGLGILGTNLWHSGIFTSRKWNVIFYRKTFCCTSFEFYVLFMILNYSFGLYWLKAINKVPKCSKIWNT